MVTEIIVLIGMVLSVLYLVFNYWQKKTAAKRAEQERIKKLFEEQMALKSEALDAYCEMLRHYCFSGDFKSDSKKK